MSISLRQTISSSLVTFLLLFLSLCCLVSYTSSNSNHNNNHNNLNRYNNHKRSLYQVSRNHDNYFYAESFRAKKTTSRPNIIFILTDDQDAELGSLDYMPKTSRYLRSQGATFSNAFSTTPMCCPSRSSMLTGMYVHNHNTYSNNENCSGPVWREKYEVNTFGKLLQDAGYLTGYFGKYLNEYSGTYIPPGWTEWMGLIKNTRYYNYTLNHNGTLIKHRDDYTKDYLTDVITRNSVEFLKRSKKHNPNSPVAMVLSMPAPHGPEDSAPQYQNLFMGSKSHRTPSWNQAPNPDKQWLLQYTRPMSKLQMEFTDLLNTKRLQTLQSVDEAVEKVCDTLNSLRELDNTYIFYTSDHGYHLGQFGLVKGKAMPYEFDIKVPFLVRGPGVPKNVTFSNIVLNLDLAPTFLDIAGLPPLPIMDGSSILKVLNNADESHGVKKRSLKWRDTFLVERGKLTAKKLRLVDKIEAQINNLTKTKNEKTKTECLKPEYNPPCKPNQKWICLRNERDELRFFKCRNHGNLSTAKPRCRCRLSLEEKVLQLTFLKTNVNQPDKIQANFIDGKSKVKRRSHSHHTSMNASHGLLDQSESANEDDLILTNEWSFIKGEVPDLTIPCRIGEEGSVDCQPLVYSNLDLWQKQTDLLEKVIKYFNVTYTNLQKLRDHLNERRPTTTTTTMPPGLHSDDGVLELSGSDGMGGTDADDATDCTCDGEDDDDDDDDGGSVQDNVVQGSLKKRSPWFVKRRRKLEKAKKTLKKQRFALESGSMDPFSRIGQKHFNRGCNGYDGCTNFHDNSTWDLSNHARSDPACQIQGLECFRMDNDHWKVKPFWERGPFCSCGNSNNNTYWCLRTINDTHNFLFCEFITGFISYYDLHKDPYQMKNAVKELSYEVLQQLLVRLGLMKNCRGKDCYFRSGGRVTAKRFSQDKYLSKQHLRKHHGKNKSW